MTDTELDHALRQLLLKAAHARHTPTLLLSEVPPFTPTEKHLRWERRFLANPFGYAKRKARPLWKKILQSAACLVLAIVFTFSALMAVSPTTRAGIVRWFIEWYDTNVTVRFTGLQSEERPCVWSPSFLPNGYEEISTENLAGLIIITYQNSNGEEITLYYQLMEDGGIFNSDRENMEISSVQINGNSGFVLKPQISGKLTQVLWTDEVSNTAFCLVSSESADTLIAVANSIFKEK